MYDPKECPRPVRARTAAEEGRQHPLLGYYVDNVSRRGFFENGEGLASEMDEAEVLQMRATYYDLMTELDAQLGWLGLAAPRACDGHSLLPFLRAGGCPDGWRSEVHYEFDFRNVFYSKPEEALGLRMDECALAVVQDERYKYG